MTTPELLNHLAVLDIHLTVAGGKIKVVGPDEALTDDLLALIRKSKQDILALMTPKPIGCAWREDQYGRLWFSDGTAYAPTTTGGWILVRHPNRRMQEPGTMEVR